VSQRNPTHRVAAALSLVLACGLLGASIGLMTAQLFATEPASGWKRLGDASGALTVGSVLGVIAGGYLAFDLSTRARWWSSLVAIMLTAGTLWSLALTAQ
jgi:hypothetical protein